MDPGVLALRDPRLRIEGQAQAHRRVARHEVAALRAQKPRPAQPTRVLVVAALERQRVANDFVEPARKHRRKALALERIFELRFERVHVDRQPALPPQVVKRVLERRENVLRVERKARGEMRKELLSRDFIRAASLRFVREQRRVLPDRLAVLAPEERERPARQRLARIPLALAVMQQAFGRVALLHLRQQRSPKTPLDRLCRRRVGGRVPFRTVAVVRRDERRLAAHGEADVFASQVRIDARTERLDFSPLLFGVRFGNARRLPDPLDFHRVTEFGFAPFGKPGDRRCAAGLRRARERNVPFAREEPRSRIQSDPSGPRKVNLAPRVEVGEVDIRAGRPVERFHVGLELDQVARDESRRQPEVAQQLDQQPAGVAARAARVAQGHFGRLHPGLHANEVPDVLLQALDQGDEEIH